MNIKSIVNNRIVKNASWMIFGRIAQMIISLVVGVLTARFLGPSNYGLINYGAAYVAFFTALCTLGLNSILVKEFVDNPENEGVIIGTSLGLRFIASVLSAILIIIIVSFVDRDEPTTIAVVALCSIGLVFHIFEAFQYRFQYQLKSKVTSIASLIAYAVTAVYKIVLLALGKSVVWFAFATSVDYICVAILLFLAYKRYDGKPFEFSFKYAKHMLSKSCHFILPGMMVAIYGQTDKMMLKHMLSGADVGYYSTATAVCTMWCFVLSAIIDSVYPSIMEANKTDEGLFKKRNKQLYAIIFYVSMAVSVLFMIFADLAIYILYGKAYAPAATPLRIITWYTAFSYLGVAKNAWVVCKNKQKYLIYVYFSAAVINVILNLVLIPNFGVSGAAFASLVAQILTTIVVPLFIPPLRENSIMMLEAICFKGLKKGE